MIPHNRPLLGPEEEAAAARVIQSGWLATGAETKQFEAEFCRAHDLPSGHAVAVSSGTAALYLALWALDAEGERVAFPAYACSALRHAVALAGGGEKLVDSDIATPNASMDVLRGAGARVVIAPHMYGLPIEFDETYELAIIEDCAHAIGARIGGKPVGMHGPAAIFSFYATKLITTGGSGGMFVSRDADIVARVRDFLDFDQRRDRNPRFNFQMNDMQAAVGRAQLARWPSMHARRAEIFERYRSAGLDLVDLPRANGLDPTRYRAVLRTDRPAEVIAALEAGGVRAICPLEDWELLGDADEFPNAYRWTQSTVSLPCYPALTDVEVDRVLRHLP
jgi:perosamine synthetase